MFSSTNGSITVNVVPFPTSLSTVMVPLEICKIETNKKSGIFNRCTTWLVSW